MIERLGRNVERISHDAGIDTVSVGIRYKGRVVASWYTGMTPYLAGDSLFWSDKLDEMFCRRAETHVLVSEIKRLYGE